MLSLNTFWNASLVQIPLPIPYIVKFSTSVSSTSKFKFRPSGDANVSIWLTHYSIAGVKCVLFLSSGKRYLQEASCVNQSSSPPYHPRWWWLYQAAPSYPIGRFYLLPVSCLLLQVAHKTYTVHTLSQRCPVSGCISPLIPCSPSSLSFVLGGSSPCDFRPSTFSFSSNASCILLFFFLSDWKPSPLQSVVNFLELLLVSVIVDIFLQEWVSDPMPKPQDQRRSVFCQGFPSLRHVRWLQCCARSQASSARDHERVILCLDPTLWPIGHFTVVCLVTWPMNASEAAGDLALIQTLD